MRGLVAVLCCGLLSGCATTNWAEVDAGPKPDLEEAKAQAMYVLKEPLFDPDSALFRRWTPLFKAYPAGSPYVRADPEWALCVEMNAKNRLGGYVGYRQHIVFVADEPFAQGGMLSSMCESGPADPDRIKE